jgi:hypothetical protein
MFGGCGKKKDETRFTIRFNPADPRHQRAMDALKASGRRKAYLIADAICEYMALHGGNDHLAALPHIKQTSLPERVLSSTSEVVAETKLSDSSIIQVVNISDVDGGDVDSAEGAPFDDDMRQTILGGLSLLMGSNSS